MIQPHSSWSLKSNIPDICFADKPQIYIKSLNNSNVLNVTFSDKSHFVYDLC